MADLKISQLTGATTPLAGTEVVPVVQSGTTKKVSVANLTAGRVVGMLRANIEGAYDAAAPSTSSVPILRVNEGGAVSLWVNGQGYSNVWVQAIQDDGSNNLKPLYLQPLGGDIYTGANIVPQVAAQGVNFTANTPAAGMTSQLLNWYEEGTFTAALTPASGSISLSYDTCKYTRVGRQVTVSGFLYVSSVSTPTGALQITGLPFSTPAGFPAYSAAAIYATNLAAGATTAMQGYITGSSSAINVTTFAAGSAGDASAYFQANSVLVFSLTYFV